MMSTVGLELANFLNADLSWKRVSKGSRSAPRRPRKPVLEIADKTTRRADDTTVSESEKVGVAVLGRRFRENIEHVPIKKRRFPFRSPPPPAARLSSPHLDISETLMATDVNGGVGVGSGKISEVISEKLVHTEDFSGIEMLAAIACNNRMVDDTDHAGGNLVVEKSTQDRTETSTSAIALAETTASLETVNISSHEDRMDGLSLQDNTVENLPSDNDGKTTENFVSLRDERLHWDLNVSMDAWEKPYDVYPQKNFVENISDSKQSEKLQVFKGCELQRETMDIKHDIEGAVQSTVGGVVSSDEHGDINMPVGLRVFSLGSDRSNGEEHELQACSGLDRIHDKCVTTTTCNALESSTYDVAITKAPTEVVSMDVNVDLFHGSDDIITNTGASEKNGNISLDSVIAKESDVALTYAPVSERTTYKIDGAIQKGDGTDTGTASGLHDDENTPEEMTSVDFCLPLEPIPLEIKPVIRAAEVDAHYSESHCKDIHVSGQSVVTKDAKGQADIASVPHNAGVNSSLHVGSEYEDGELRELNVHCCKENEGAYGELEFVNNYSHNMDTSDVDDVDYLTYEKVQVGIGCREESSFVRNTEKNVEVQQGSSLGSDTIIERTGHFATADAVKEPLVRSETKSGADNSPLGHKISDKLTVGVTEGSTMRKIPDDSTDGLNEKNCPLELVEPKISEKDSEFVQRSRSDNFDSCTRAEMDDATDHSIGRDKSALHVKIPTVGRLISPSTGYWDSKHCGSPTYFDSYGSGRPRPKSAVESCGYVMTSDCTMSGAVWVARVDNRVYRPSPRRRSPSDRADAYGIRRGMAPVREISSDRKFQRYPVGGVSRGPREEYHRPVLDGSRDYSYRVPYHMAKGEHSISSPSKGRPLHYTQPYRKSRSRSRSRSPVEWLLPRERSEGSRHHRSQSPDHRFEAGMERVRLPLQKPIFSADNEAGFMSPPRRRFSPQRNSRWFGDQIEPVDHFKGRRFSVRTFQQSQRFDPVHSPRGLDSDDYFEPMIRPGRFVDMDSTGRGCSDNDRRKHGGRYEIIHPVRRYGKNGVVRRFRYGAEDCLVSQNSHNYDDYDRGIDRRLRDVPRRVNEDKGHLRYNHGGLFDSSSNSFRTQDA